MLDRSKIDRQVNTLSGIYNWTYAVRIAASDGGCVRFSTA